MTTPPNTDALRRSVYSIAYDILRASGGKIPRNPTAVTDEIMQLIAQHDQARLTAILAKLPQKFELHPENDLDALEVAHDGYNQAVDHCTTAITAAFEAVV